VTDSRAIPGRTKAKREYATQPVCLPRGPVACALASRVRVSATRLEVSGLFEPFCRLTADRTDHGGGAGLGLSIVRSITAAHNGTIRARPQRGGGLIVEIDLPPASSAADD
jgi:light-regulated signal transduction histidine kinase (bacteriophytochrome)